MKKIDNKGFTLIEMLVSVLITGLLMLGVSTFMTSSRVSYSRVNTSVSLQEEAGTTVKFLNEIIMESKEWDIVELSHTNPNDVKVIWFRALDNEEGVLDADSRTECIYFIIWEKETKCIRYKKVAIGDESDEFNRLSYAGDDEDHSYLTGLISSALFDDYSLISRYAESISINRDGDNLKKYSISIIFKYNGEEYVANVNSISRNDK